MRMRFKDVSATLCDKITNVPNAMSSDQTEITENLALRCAGFSIKFLDKKKNVSLDLQNSLEDIYTFPVFFSTVLVMTSISLNLISFLFLLTERA